METAINEHVKIESQPLFLSDGTPHNFYHELSIVIDGYAYGKRRLFEREVEQTHRQIAAALQGETAPPDDNQ